MATTRIVFSRVKKLPVEIVLTSYEASLLRELFGGFSKSNIENTLANKGRAAGMLKLTDTLYNQLSDLDY